MAAQLLSEKQIQMPHLPEQIREAAYRQELPIHPCQCHCRARPKGPGRPGHEAPEGHESLRRGAEGQTERQAGL